MKSPETVPRVQHFSIAICVLFGFAFCYSSETFASCGDYVQVGNAALENGRLATSGLTNSSHPNGHNGENQRCHGPNCSRPSVPVNVPITPVERPVEQWAFCDLLPANQTVAAGEFVPGHSESADGGYRLGIMRPPR
jgi:hypothetical protein